MLILLEYPIMMQIIEDYTYSRIRHLSFNYLIVKQNFMSEVKPFKNLWRCIRSLEHWWNNISSK